jgi:DeoR/GlpR family transcriptional regulator of sugar metabolism/DNA-binding Xre family transcriptional regulator
MSERSLRANAEGIRQAEIALTSRVWGREDLQRKIGISRQPIVKFFTGKPIDRKIFAQICQELGLEWQDISAGSDLDFVVNSEAVEVSLSQSLSKSDSLVLRSLEMLQDIDGYLTTVANQIRSIVRPYQKSSPLSISELVAIWNSKNSSSVNEIEFRKLLIQLQVQKRLAGITLYGEHIFEDEEYYGWKTLVATDEKKQIAVKAVSLISSGNIIVLDAGSTTIEIARQLSQSIKMGRLDRLTVITNFFKVADELLTTASEMSLEEDNQIIQVYMVGGRIRLNTLAIVHETDTLRNSLINDLDTILKAVGGADIAFVGTNGISQPDGFTTASISEKNTKQSMLRWGRRKIIVTDPYKFGLKKEHVFATFDECIEVLTVKNQMNQLVEDFDHFFKSTSTKLIYA